MDRVFLDGFSTTAGFLQHAPVIFSRHLTCIIGARGTCKSTLIESIRFCLTRDEVRTAMLLGRKPGDASHPAYGIVKDTLGAGTARMAVSRQTPDGDVVFSIERNPDSEPLIYRDTVRQHANLDILECFEIYSQGDLQRIADGEGNRLGLIDRPNLDKILAFKQKRKAATDELRSVGARLKTNRAELLKVETELRGAASLEAQLADLQSSRPKLSAELEASRAEFLRRRSALALMNQVLTKQQEAIEHLQETVRFDEAIRALADQVDAVGQPDASVFTRKVREVADRLRSAVRIVGSISELGLVDAVEDLASLYEAQDESYYVLQRQQNEINDAIKREDILRQQIEHMDRQRAKATELRHEQDELLRRRARHRSEVDFFSATIYDLRLEQVEQINNAHGDLVLLSLQVGSQSEAYVSRLSSMLAGSRIRDQREVAEDLASRVTPSQLIDLVEASDVQRLADILDRDLGQMTRVVSQLVDHDGLYDLEAAIPEDHVSITLIDGGVAKPIETLSKGQRATALLPLILRPSSHPLIIDQPEDDLDNSFIFKSLVQTVHELKSERQIIFVTHNANIPVLGEAEQVIVMTMATPKEANPPEVGSIDERKREILELLEGGALAFEERHKRYAPLL